jgi:hypothetical protein
MVVVKVGLTSACFTWIGVLQGLPAVESQQPDFIPNPRPKFPIGDREPALERAFLTGHSGFLP